LGLTTYLNNRTPFATELFAFPNADGQEIAVLVISASFLIDQNEADVAIYKPYVDVIINATAYSPHGRPSNTLEVGIQLADIHKHLIIQGDRKSLVRGVASKPQPFITMPIVYERAYGGTYIDPTNPDRQDIYTRNPVGVEYKGALSADPGVQTNYPNINYLKSSKEYRQNLPAGFGAIARSWSPRRELAGTYDEDWLKNQWPLPPHDYNPLHNQAAPVDQQSRTIQGGEEIMLLNLTTESEWCFRLPSLTFPTRLFFGRRPQEVLPKLDTILIDADSRTVTLSHRLAIPIERKNPLREVVLGHVTRGWLLARERKKYYHCLNGSNGVQTLKPTYK